VNLRVMDPSEIPGRRFDAQLAAMIQARDEGLIDGIGLSNISRLHLLRAVDRTQIVCVLSPGWPHGCTRPAGRSRRSCRQGRLPVPGPGQVPRVVRRRPAGGAGRVHGGLPGPWGVNALGGMITEAAWRVKPSWYLVAGDDHMIPPPAQRAMSERASSTVSEAPGSHSIYVSQPAVVASLITQAATAARG
jgi:hypothetical protein